MEETKNTLKIIERDSNGLVSGVEYKFTPEGLIDWRGILPIQYLYINNDLKKRDNIEKTYGKPYDQIDIIKDNVKDNHLVILLGGIKFLGRLRGFSSVSYLIKESNPDYASVNCSIKFIPNYETEGREIEFQDNACATRENTYDFASKYLVEIATNRAFCRTVRSFLGISIVSKEELGEGTVKEESKPKQTSNTKQVAILDDLMKSKGVTWKILTQKMKDEGKFKDSFETLKDLDKDLIFEFIDRLKKMPNS